MRPRVFLTFIVVFTLFPTSGRAQQPNDSIRNAANATKFKVIKRIPSSEPDSLLFAPVKSPYPDGFDDLVVAKEWESAWKLVEKLRPAVSPFDFQYAYVALRVAQKTNDKALAKRSSEILAGGKSTDMQSYYDYYAALAAFESEQWEIAAAKSATVPKESVLHTKSSYLLARSLFRLGDFERAERAYKSLVKSNPRDIGRAETQKDAADAYIGEGKWDDAVRHLRSNVIDFAGTSFENEAKKTFGAIESKVPKPTKTYFEGLSNDDVLDVYERLFDAHSSQRVVEELPKYFKKFKAKSRARCRAEFLVAKSYTKLRKHPEALKAYVPVLKTCKGSDEYLKSLYQRGRSEWNAGNPTKALKTFQRLQREFPKHSYADDAMLYQAKIQLELGKESAAQKTLRAQLEKYPDGDMAPDAQWLLFRKDFATEKYTDAIKFAATQRDEGDLYSAGRLTYFSARAESLRGDNKNAKKKYQEVVKEFPLSYYALLAVNRLGELENVSGADVCSKGCDFFADSFSEIKVPERVKSSAGFVRGKRLLSLGLSDLSEREFLRLRADASKQEYWALAWVLHHAGVFSFSHDLARRHLGDWESTYPSDDVRWEISYPAPYEELVDKASKTHRVEKAVIYAIMREESGFNPAVKSWAGAYGLMQLMPGTAKISARTANIPYQGAPSLFQPEVAIDIGTAYLSELSTDASGHPALIIGGYNGGWGNMSRWLKENPSPDLDLWVEDITYGQTRNYTKRVLRSYWVYKWLYEDVTGPRLKMVVR